MYAAVDVHYPPAGGARAALVLAPDAAFATIAPAAHAIPVVRGSAARPLYVTAAGIPPVDAAELVRTMTGKFRLPDALRRVDALARGKAPASRGGRV